MRRLTGFIIVIGLLVPLHDTAVAQSCGTPEQCRQRIAETERELARLRGLIGVNRNEQQSLQKEINGLLGQISYMQNQIEQTSVRIELTGMEITGVETRISDTQKNIDEKLRTIGNIIAVREQQDHESLIANLLRFENLSDFFQEVHDAVSVHERLNALMLELTGYRAELESYRQDLEGKRSNLEQLSQEQEYQKAGLNQAKYAKDKVLADTKGQESAYQAALTEVEKLQQAFFIELQQMENRIIAGGTYIVHVEATGVPPPGTKIFSAPEAPGYTRTQGYGYTTYAARGAYGGAIHNGYDIATGTGTLIRPIGPGVVIANGTSDGWGNWVAIQHTGHYNIVSVYAHMSSFANGAIVGSNVTTSSVIGYEGTTGYSTGSHLHLSLYKKFFTFKNDKTGQLAFNYSDTLNPASYVNL